MSDPTPGRVIAGESDLLAYLDADSRHVAARHLYKSNDCGVRVRFRADGVDLGAGVDGCYLGTMIYPLAYPFTAGDLAARIAAIEEEVVALWKWANAGPLGSDRTWMELGVDPPDVGAGYAHLGQAGRST